MKCQRQILRIRWSDIISNVDVQAHTGLTPLGEILAAHMALCKHIDLSVDRLPGLD